MSAWSKSLAGTKRWLMGGRVKHDLLRIFLGRWFFVAYFLLGLLHFALATSMVSGSAPSDVIFVTLGLLTGSDPFSFGVEVKSHLSIWCLAWLIHVGSWLIMPALIGLLIGEVAEEINNRTILKVSLAHLATAAGVPESKVDECIVDIERDFEIWAAKKE